jgi:F-box protein 9
MDESNPELESFRKQWKAEVSAKAKSEGSKHPASASESSRASRRPPAAPRIAADKAPIIVDDEEDHVDPYSFGGLDPARAGAEHGESSKAGSAEPQSALEHYEKGVEKESQGSLGDSLAHYRKAFKVWLS